MTTRIQSCVESQPKLRLDDEQKQQRADHVVDPGKINRIYLARVRARLIMYAANKRPLNSASKTPAISG